MTDASAAAALRRTLLAGGTLLIAGAVVTFAQTGFFSSPLSIVLSWLGTLSFSAALLVFAFGLGPGGSIVRRRPLAVTAAVVVAVWPIVTRVVTLVIPYEQSPDFSQAWSYSTWTVTLAALAVFVVQIARAGVVRGRVRWMPLWGLVLVVAPQVLAQLLIVALGVDLGVDEQEWVFLVFGLGQLLAFAVPVTLGIMALLIADRPASQGPVQVYPPAA